MKWLICLADLPPNWHRSHEHHYTKYIHMYYLILSDLLADYFWIIREVINQLALWSLVRCNPLDTPSTPKHPPNKNTDFNSESSYLPCFTCNMDVRVHIGRLRGRSTPQSSIDPLNTTTPNMLICTMSYWQIYWPIYPLVEASSGQEWQFQSSIVRVHISRSTGSLPPSQA